MLWRTMKRRDDVKSMGKGCNDFFSAPYLPKILAKSLKTNLKIRAFRTFSEISRFYLGFADSDNVTARARDTALY